MKRTDLSRREFSKLTMAAFGGAVAGVAASASGAWAADDTKKDIHVCRGLNECKSNGADGKNKCAGQGQCATAKAHTCSGGNECKGQGGCGETPGENACKGKGKCGVPLMDKAWDKARKRFEERMKKAGKKFGSAPKKK